MEGVLHTEGRKGESLQKRKREKKKSLDRVSRKKGQRSPRRQPKNPFFQGEGGRPAGNGKKGLRAGAARKNIAQGFSVGKTSFQQQIKKRTQEGRTDRRGKFTHL